MPNLVETVKRLKDWDKERLLGLLRSYDNGATLADAVSHIAKRLTEIAASLTRRGGVMV
jgi:4-phosphopantoate--beta-alanine ligase